MNQSEYRKKTNFSLDLKFKDPLQNLLFKIVRVPIELILEFPRLNRAYAKIKSLKDDRAFPEKALDHLKVNYEIAADDLSRLNIPKGPVIIVANHPFGIIEGMILLSILKAIRSDMKFMANHLLHVIPELRDVVIAVNPFKEENAMRDNVKPIRESIQWVKNGGMLVVFPAGTVSYFDFQKGVITDPDWSPSIARIIRSTGASVLPIFFGGTNSPGFHLAGLIHPFFRTSLLPRELFNKGRTKIQLKVGDLIPYEKLNNYAKTKDIMDYLRLRTYALEHRRPAKTILRIKNIFGLQKNNYATILTPQIKDILTEEMRLLSPHQKLVENEEYEVVYLTADQAPHLLLEIGRLREITFRAVGEGTGKSIDLDNFDYTYMHLVVWNRVKQEVVGAYRLGKTNQLIETYGLKGLYTNTLFRFRSEFFERLGPALEMGRSFVRPEYQKSFSSFLLLWKGIGQYIVKNPQYKTLFGPVSISADYHSLSRQLMVKYLKMTRFNTDMAGFVKARKPLHFQPWKSWDIDAAVRLTRDDVENISELISCIENDRKGIPVLLQQYLKLGGQIAGFNIDPNFGNVLDGLIMVDLTQAETRVVERYMGKEGARDFFLYHTTTMGARI